ncbi:hypothetical protein A3F07_00935 [candidate division WWE3 bacterium RIFCSPHIGHO2_12_FULL_38_15]|uniref:Uncharacterized protein n=1 Tax=candidate division WWE3 bacterium RIFCSPHIGHO2_02_FULL_38_14 TaxID=1802620 RepID=A0A1F4VA93_UNCKA|nr:MAG: hypothetical protein A2793_03865 [candidate division WWE3 bacterium RIFCSPHIGHO2_01_FULL_38_45]OGC49139.1 MAG: hypothetical protein A3F07_00935 [candidate division WWE3 bacterium RIFCSPHIGHO2_12_FULL_38_15]OGC52595.1 MAG: hypothetical protein A3B64_03470 [candidate division WWE3 bacterium RIFCSPLOWO2_01_FULL_37_24]OGC54086.1 MAG: hypothetical protein A3D91_04995 [candidate division WWE3 bacterium RIFCSPHIGHO2_02_FULL_38_14]
MNALGHTYIAFKVIGKLNEMVIIGSHVNDLVPFIPNSVFSWEEIHESPEKVYFFVKEKYPEMVDFPVAMLTHSVKYGVDYYNRSIVNWFLKGNKDLENNMVEMIIDCSGVSEKVAREYRMHNYLWVGVEIYLLKKHNDFVKDIERFDLMSSINVISKMLSECFGKNYNDVFKDVKNATETLNEFKIYTFDGILDLWKKTMAGLPEKDVIDKEKTGKVFEFIYNSFEDRWEKTLGFVEIQVKNKIHEFLIT